MTEVDGGWSRFAGVQWSSQSVPRNGHDRSLHWFVLVGRAALPPPIRLDDLYPKQKDQLPITMSLRGRQAVAIFTAAVGCAEM